MYSENNQCRERDPEKENFFEDRMILEIIIQKSGERLLTELSGRIIELPERRGMQFKTSIINGHVLDGFSRDFVGNEGNVTLQPLATSVEIKLRNKKKEKGRRRGKRETEIEAETFRSSRHRRGVCDHG